MPSPLDRKSNDLAVIRVPPLTPTDLRVPTAEEETLNSEILMHLVTRTRKERGWTRLPDFGVSQRKLTLSSGQATLPIYPGLLDINTSITLTPLPDTSSTVSRADWIYLIAFGAEVGATQDPLLGQFGFQGRYVGSTEIVVVQKENTRRLRAFWALVLSSAPLTPESFLALLPIVDDRPVLTVTDTSEAGFNLGNLRFYGRDPNLSQVTYNIFPDTLYLMETCQVLRRQNQTDRGFVWGYNGESGLQRDYHIVSTAPLISNEDLENRTRLRLREIFSGKPGGGFAYNRSVQNLLSVPIGSNPGYPGEAAGSPNGSVCLANNQRVSFTNQAIIEKFYCQPMTATNDGTGRPVISLSLNSAPFGSFFSANRLDHRIYSASGIEQADRGNFTGLGTNGLIWTGDANSTISPGETVYVAPGIFYAAGSGFSIPFDSMDAAWRDNIAISPSNIRQAATDDLITYAAPANNENFFVVYGQERAALHYILKKVSVTTNSNGVAVIPTGELGCFAVIQGVLGRVDAPVQTGLSPNQNYNALIYYPPRSAEAWQFSLRYAQYQGTGDLEPTFLSGATVISNPIFFIHTQGGGSSVHQGEAATRLSPIAMHLPAVDAPSVPPYRFNARVRLAGEPRQGPITLREMQLLPATNLALPSPGQTLSLLPATTPQSQSLQGKLALSDGQLVGFRVPQLANRAEFQAVVAFVVEKEFQKRLVVLTRNTIGSENVAADSDQQTAIDTFRL